MDTRFLFCFYDSVCPPSVDWNLQASLTQKASFTLQSLNFSERGPISSSLISAQVSAVAAVQRFSFRQQPEPSASYEHMHSYPESNFGNLLREFLLIMSLVLPPVCVSPHC